MRDSEWHTFRDIDSALALPKGSAFRAFKRVRDELTEDKDFVVLRADCHAHRIGVLRRTNRIYAASVNVVLLGEQARRRVIEKLQARQ